MLTLNEETPIYMETLNAFDKPMMEITARLRHLSEQSAVITFDSNVKIPGLHCGSRVRFGVESNSQHYAITGIVIATNLKDTAVDTDEVEGWREILVRVWDCQSASQRRKAPRKRARFAVKYQPFFAENEAGSDKWLAAQCVDISAGGMRLRVACPEVGMERVRLALSLPASDKEPHCELRLAGRVLRLERSGGARQMALIAVKFERLTPQDALMLARYSE